jgi:diguanylate cyclase (GGDEF)-like protein/PAS domain S-box-containing protein
MQGEAPMAAGPQEKFVNFFEADLTSEDIVFLGPFQERMHKKNTVQAMIFAYCLVGLSLFLARDALTGPLLAATAALLAMMTFTRPTNFWARIGIKRAVKRIQAQAAMAATSMVTFIALPLAAGWSDAVGLTAIVSVATVVFGQIAYAFAPDASKTFGGITTPALVATVASEGSIEAFEYAAIIALCGATGFTVCKFIFSNFATRFVRERDLSEAADTVKLLLNDYEEQVSDWLWEIDASGRFVNYSQRGVDATGRTIEQLARMNPMDLLHRESDRDRLLQVLRTRQPFRDLEVAIMVGQDERWFRLSGTPQLTPEGRVVRTRGVCSDITEAKRAEAQIAYMARYDALTDLPNRTLFSETLDRALKRRKSDELLAVLYLDLDQFKGVNDTLGHGIGDKVLQVAAQRISACVSVKDLVSRQGGDEFAVLLSEPAERAAADSVAAAIISALSEPMLIDNHNIVLGTSIGIAFAPDDAAHAEDLIKRADLALYHSKQAGRGKASHFAISMQKMMQARQQVEADLRKAITQNEFALHFQPLINLQTGKAVGHEALIRWHHPKRGLVMPDSFIPVAEETGLIVPIGEWVIRSALAEAAHWPQHLVVSVNLSPVQIASPGLVPTIVSALAATGIPPHRLEVEITESVLMNDTEANMQVLHQLRSLGVQIALDDFGTGYSSLNYLRGFPFDKIKIDRCFVSDADMREDSRAIIRAVTSLANSLGIITTAEGVEREQELEVLRAEGCTQVQGYYFSQPVPAEAIADRQADTISAAAVIPEPQRRAG